ncbi:uncharacterized protein MYCGRDRAFT_80292 [Zymoseptoria tritici IPO323]|uniref:Transmembrane protein n=1 Tax=Zymoseptoria tritici (strain CBS 115943 / IPO323) TaxID=336722 RepID=F9X8Q2_ZYMTI|nr:uncharacterized protein MYCGRDRAFT_80292 [Zymoseptoria tritici IPO323]EGP88540.1 hypothetical protein MYCGRDRAFT_80292 [Zymoseptoria tritici IPO323]
MRAFRFSLLSFGVDPILFRLSSFLCFARFFCSSSFIGFAILLCFPRLFLSCLFRRSFGRCSFLGLANVLQALSFLLGLPFRCLPLVCSLLLFGSFVHGR